MTTGKCARTNPFIKGSARTRGEGGRRQDPSLVPLPRRRETTLLLSQLGNTRGFKLRSFHSTQRVQAPILPSSTTNQDTFRGQRLPRPLQTSGSASAGTPAGAEGSHRRGPRQVVPRVLQSTLSSRKGLRRVAPSHRSECLKQILPSNLLQDGDTGIYQNFPQTWGVDNVGGPLRRLPTHTGTQNRKKILQVCGGKKGFPVRSNPFWSGLGSQTVYKDREGRQGNVISPGRVNSCIPRRPLTEGQKQRGGSASHTNTGYTASQSRVCNKHEKIRSSTHTSIPFCGLRIRPNSGDCLPTSRQSEQHRTVSRRTTATQVHNSGETLQLPRRTFSHRENGPIRPSPHETPTNDLETPLEIPGPFTYPGSPFTRSGPGMVGEPKQLVGQTSSALPSPPRPGVHGLLYEGMGCTLWESHSQGPLVLSGLQTTHKLPRIVSSSSGSHEVPAGCGRQGSARVDGQLHHPVPYKQTGGDAFTTNAGFNEGPAPVVPVAQYNPEGSTHCRGEECGGRCALENTSVLTNRVDVAPTNFPTPLSNLGNTRDRHFRDQIQSPPSGLYFTNAGPRCSSDRRFEPSLGGEISVRIPTSGTPVKSGPKNSEGKAQNDADSPVVASSALAPRAPEVVNPNTKTSTSSTISATSDPQQNVQPGIGNTQSTCISDTTLAASDSVAARVAAPQRVSTRRVYAARLTVFKNWCQKSNVEWPLSNSDPVLSFLLEQFHLGRAPSTLEGYRSSLADSLPELNLTQDKRLSRLLQSFHRDRPRAAKVLPPWDLQVVLEVLSGPPFEPLTLIPLKLVTFKTVFLLALASGSRRSEIHAWVKAGVMFDSDAKHVYLKAASGFLAKNQRLDRSSSAFSPVVIPALTDSNDLTGSETTLCPVRALKLYLDRTHSIRNAREKLFISFKAGHKQEIKPQTISSWLRQTITLAYSQLKPEQAKNLNIKAHHIRAMASSWANLGGVALTDIMTSCHWRSHTTFTSYYLKEVSWHNGDEFTLGPFVTAQSVIDPTSNAY